MKAKREKMGNTLRWCVSLPSPPFLFFSHFSFSCRGILEKHKHLLHDIIANNIHLAPMRACLCPAPDGALDGAAGEFNRAGNSR